MLKAVLFDLDGTLWRPKQDAEGIFASRRMVVRAEKIAPQLDVDRETALEIVNGFWEEWRAVYAGTGDHREPDGVSELGRYLASRGLDVPPEVAGACWRAMRIAAHEFPFELFDDTQACLARVRNAGLAAAVVTNNYRSEMLLEDLHAYGISVPVVICSADVGWRKPHRLIFSRALQSLGMLPEDVIMVGDSFENDVLGARAMGIRAVLKTNGREVREDDRDEADFVIENLADLFEDGILPGGQ